MSRDVEGLPASRAMPCVDLALQLVAPPEQGLVEGHELIQQRGESAPEARGVQSQLGSELLLDQLRQFRRTPAVHRARSS